MTPAPLLFHGHPGSAVDFTLCPAANAPLPPGTIIGFSLGAHAALAHAAAYPKDVSRVILISAAAPLQAGDFLRHMAGAPVFRAALRGPRALRVMSTAQAWAFKLPGLARRMLLAGAAPADQAVLSHAPGATVLTRAIKHSFGTGQTDYQAALLAYVADWRALVPRITCPVDLHHGAQDTWALLGMAQWLAATLPNAHLHIYPDEGHYSTLSRVPPL